MSRKGFVHDDLRTVFFWSEKSACTTLFSLLRENFGETNKYYQKNSQNWHECVKILEIKKYKSIVIARHPMTRIVSAYLNKFVTYKNKPLYYVEDLEGFSQNLYKDHLRLRDFDVGDLKGRINDLNFEWFSRTVIHLHKSRANPDENSLDGHWDTQVPPGLLEMDFAYDRVVYVESLDHDLVRLCRDYGLRFSGTVHNATPMVTNGEPVDCLADLPPRELVGRRLAYAAFLARETRRQLQDLFLADFRMFGYGHE